MRSGVLTASVAMAVYNGEKYLQEQLISILQQLDREDELIVSVDPSSDNSWALLQQYAKEDSRIRLLKGPGQGVIANFSNALQNCGNDIIFLCDQDDVWVHEKINKIKKVFLEQNVNLIVHDALIVDKSLNPDRSETTFFAWRKSKDGFWRNIMRNSYIGCCMAFKRSLLDVALPFPKDLPMHDQWLGLLAELTGEVYFYPEILIKYRRHGQNVSASQHSGIMQMVKWRADLVTALLKRWRKVRRYRRK